MFELVEDVSHIVEHLGSAEPSDDEVVVVDSVVKGFCLWSFIRVRVPEELESEFGVFLKAEEGRQLPRRDGF